MHQAVDGAFGWGFDIDQPVMGANFKVFAGVFVNKGAAEDTETANTRREWHRASDLRAGALDRIDDFRCRRVQGCGDRMPGA